MNYNLVSGGLILKAGDKLISSNVKKLTTEFGTSTLDGMFWFVNFDGTSVFYSDQKRGNALYKFSIEGQTSELILDKPCYGLYLNKEWLYYINEHDQNIYRCLTNGKSETKIVNEQVGGFILDEENIFYTTTQGIKRCNETGSEKKTLSDAEASNLISIGSMLVFADKNNQHVLTFLNLNTNSTKVIDQIAPSSLNTDGRYLYCANRLNNKSVYRIDPETGSSIRICGESVEYLHVIENELYFCIDGEWHKMSLEGGQASRLI